MEKELDQAINFCIAALNNKVKGSQEVEGNSDYVLATLQKIAKMPYQGRNIGIGDYRTSFEQMMKQCLRSKLSFSLDWLHVILVLFDFTNYDETKMLALAEKIVNDNIIFNHVLKHIIANLVTMGNIEMAEQFIPNFKTTVIFKEQNNLDMGYLIILEHYAQNGDDKNFFKYFKLSKPAINKNEVSMAKDMLVKNYTQNNSIEHGIELCKHKNIGSKFYFSALLAFAEQGKYQELKQIFEKYPQLKQAETELQILIAACMKAKELNLPIDDDFEELFFRTLQVDRKLKWGDAKLQDSLFFDLGFANEGNKERMLRCRKKIKANSLKKELIVK